MISDAEAFSDDNVVATESALGALGKVIYAQRKDCGLLSDGVVAAFLDKLPLTHEEEEAQKTHKLFFKHLLAGGASVICSDGGAKAKAALLRIAKAVEIQGKDENLEIVNEEGLGLMKKLM